MESFTQKKDKSLSVLHGEAATSSVENAGIAYQAPSLLAIGGSARDVALLSSVTNLIFALISFKIPSVVKSGDSLKRSTILLAALSAIAWLPLILVPLFISDLSIAVLIGLWVLSLAPSLLIIPIRDKWMADLIPANRMGRYFGLRQIFAAGSYLTTFLMMGHLLDSPLKGINNSFTLVFTIAFIGSLVSLLLYLVVRTSDSAPKEAGSRFGLLDFLHETKQNSMGSFMVYVTLVTFTASISGAFFSVYMLDDLHFSYLTYTLVISIEFIARMVSLAVWGKIVDSSGALKLMKAVSWAIPFIPVFWLFSANIGYLMAVQFISGVAWAAFDLSNQTHICAASPEDKKLHYIVYQRAVITLASAVGPLLGAYLVNFMFPIYGSQILGIFLLSGILRLAVVAGMSHKLRTEDSPGTGETRSAMGTFALYEAGHKNPVDHLLGYPRFARKQSAVVVQAKRQVYSRDVVHSLSGTKPLNASVKQIESGITFSGSPFHQALYAQRRQKAADMLRQKVKPVNLESQVHRLTLAVRN